MLLPTRCRILAVGTRLWYENDVHDVHRQIVHLMKGMLYSGTIIPFS